MTDEEWVMRHDPRARVVGFGYLSGQVHIITAKEGRNVYLSDAFPVKHEDCDEECNCDSDWQARGTREAWADAQRRMEKAMADDLTTRSNACRCRCHTDVSVNRSYGGGFCRQCSDSHEPAGTVRRKLDRIGCSQECHLPNCGHFGESGAYLSQHARYCASDRGYECICNPKARAEAAARVAPACTDLHCQVVQDTLAVADKECRETATLLKEPSAFLHELTADELVQRAVSNAVDSSKRKGEMHLLWVAFAEFFALGSGYSKDLCLKCGHDPDEEVKR